VKADLASHYLAPQTGAGLAATNNPTIVKSKHVCPLLKECAEGMMDSHRKNIIRCA
jgi:hypothetical protein